MINDGNLVGNPEGGADITTVGSLENNRVGTEEWINDGNLVDNSEGGAVGVEEPCLEGICDWAIIGVTETNIVGNIDGPSDFIEGSSVGQTEVFMEGAYESFFEGM